MNATAENLPTTSTTTDKTETALVPAFTGDLELLDARWDLNSGRTVRFRIVGNGHRVVEHPFAEFVQRRGNRVGTRFAVMVMRIGDERPFFEGEMMLAGGGNPLGAGMWVKFFLDEEASQHPFAGCTARSVGHPGDIFSATFYELDDDNEIIDPTKRQKIERLADDHGSEAQRLSQYVALLGQNELFIQWLAETVFLGTSKERRPAEWWRKGDHVARWVRWVCKVESRSELDRRPEAAERFHRLIRHPYSEWRNVRED